MARAFENIRILDFSQVLAGPFATQQLALLGADVIKIEPLKGEGGRHYSIGQRTDTARHVLDFSFGQLRKALDDTRSQAR